MHLDCVMRLKYHLCGFHEIIPRKLYAYLCELLMGFHAAMAVSVMGLKMMVSSRGSTATPSPWDDLRPTRFTGRSVPSAGGPDASTAVDMLNNLQS